MQNHEALPGEPVEWRHTFRYAEELIREGILGRDEVIFHLSHYMEKDPEEAYDWLVTEACNRHIRILEEVDDDISVDFFHEKEIPINQEIYRILSSKRERLLNKLGSLSLRALGATLIVGSTVNYLNQVNVKGLGSDRGLNMLTTHLFVCGIGALLLRKSLEKKY